MLRLIRSALGVVVVVVAAVSSLGLATGWLASVVTEGTSMQPSHHAGDLVVVARTGDYGVGQVAAYRDAPTGKIVLHRIIGGDADGFVFRGDNNRSIDLGRPNERDVIGRQVVHVPKIGVVVATPIGAAAVLATLALVGAILMSPRRSHAVPTLPAVGTGSLVDHTGSNRPGRRRGGRGGGRGRGRTVVVTVLVVVDVASLVALAAALRFPPHEVVPPPHATHVGSLSYSAEVAASETYPEGDVDTGDPVFTQLVRALDVTFTYDNPEATTVASARLGLQLSNGSGWTNTQWLAPLTPVSNGSAELRGVVDLGGVQALLDRVGAATGMAAGPIDAVVTGSVEVRADDGTRTEFVTTMPLSIDQRTVVLGVAPTDTPLGPAVVNEARIDGSDPTDDIATESGGVPRPWRKMLVVVLLACVAATVVAWPTGPARAGSDDDAPVGIEALTRSGARDAYDEQGVHLERDADPVIVSGRVSLPEGVVHIIVADRQVLGDLAHRMSLPIVRDHHDRCLVVAPHGVYSWQPPAGIITERLPVVERPPLFRAAAWSSCGPAADPATLGHLVQLLGHPAVQRAAGVEQQPPQWAPPPSIDLGS